MFHERAYIISYGVSTAIPYYTSFNIAVKRKKLES